MRRMSKLYKTNKKVPIKHYCPYTFIPDLLQTMAHWNCQVYGESLAINVTYRK